MCDGPDLFLCALSILFPPIGVWIKRGICSADSIINILLCVLGYIPGLIHSWYIICSYPDSYERIPDGESHVHVYYVRPGGAGGAPPPSAGPPPGGHSSPQAPGGGYGTIKDQPQPRELPTPAAASSGAEAGSSSQAAQSSTRQPAVDAKVAGADLPSGPVQDAGPAPEEGSSEGAVPPPSYADAVRGNNKIQSHA